MGTVLSPSLYFSYGQFLVYDESVDLPGCDWTEEHSAQGFARRESVVNFSTLLEFGESDVTVYRGTYVPRKEYERVVAVPFHVVTGVIVVEGVEEAMIDRRILLPPGHYRLTAAQYVIGDEEEVIELYFEPRAYPLERSEILLADEALAPPTPLVETAGIAGNA